MERKRLNSDVTAIASSSISSHVLMALALILVFASPTTLASSSRLVFATKDHLFPEFIKWHIYIVNGLSNNQNLFTQCQSKEDDLGIHNLSPGSNLTWSFRTDFFHSTMFWCHVSKDSASASFKVFWYDSHLFDKCNWKTCIWVAKDDGVYLTDLSKNVDEFRYKWDAGM